MSTRPGRPDLRGALLEHAVTLTRELGPDAVSLREVQRRSGVSTAAAYRHYRDREALLLAVGQQASALLADTIQIALDAVPAPSEVRGSDASRHALTRLRTGIEAYLDFMRREPGLFRAVFLTGENPEQLTAPDPASRGAGGRGPYQLLQECLDDLVTAGVLSEPAPPWTDVAVWAATHGLAVLMLDGPLRFLDEQQAQAATARLLDLVLAGLTSAPPPGASQSLPPSGRPDGPVSDRQLDGPGAERPTRPRPGPGSGRVDPAGL